MKIDANIIVQIRGLSDEIRYACDILRKISNDQDEKYKEIAFLLDGFDDEFWRDILIGEEEIYLDFDGESAFSSHSIELEFGDVNSFFIKIVEDLAYLLPNTIIEGEFSEYNNSFDEYLGGRYIFNSEYGSKFCTIIEGEE